MLVPQSRAKHGTTRRHPASLPQWNAEGVASCRCAHEFEWAGHEMAGPPPSAVAFLERGMSRNFGALHWSDRFARNRRGPCPVVVYWSFLRRQSMSKSLSAVDFASRLVSVPSVSRDSNVPATELSRDLLVNLGFEVEWLEYLDAAGVRKSSVVGRRGPAGPAVSTSPSGFAYFCHTDTVPAETCMTRSTGRGPRWCATGGCTGGEVAI